jgi:hypothetical protein
LLKLSEQFNFMKNSAIVFFNAHIKNEWRFVGIYWSST